MILVKDFLINVSVSIVILIFGWWLSSIIGQWFSKAIKFSPHIDVTVVPILSSLAIWSIRVFTIMTILARFGLETTSIIALLGAAGLAIGLALQGTLQNIAAGIMLLLLRPVRSGELICLKSGEEGTVSEIGLFLTRMIQNDGTSLTLPNSNLWNSTIVNFSRNPNRRIDIPVLISYKSDVDLAINTIIEVVKSNPLILIDPAPLVKVIDYKEFSIVINIRVWSDSSKYWDLRWGLYHQIWTALSAAGFEAPIIINSIAR
ncbi:mechanosensitive ion channel protein [Candidatus Kinetoplastibacterium blastocrithidii TCC012E]|uniref:Small-conductance mechanosensitive channel n=1 Tax=Candidatus Kinetoplastidibacterium blastocrithidiae TCC012E TaxID=1208922 RepID=M1M348_9PROT|nr:mechanosensitive ion channel domain-containing protein [Candidatus Kinetoplastibacterium blastocrithidii]AFZ83502.1 small conductance mechanosensitive channel [Candidatus Kinetoplastibacterium blastocrithidii (ex Strigomonas culicis)]AGF49599.1 mechanosensitive ion channel protein [Candidatus Kinetoplastibacterium blastocrithidii TCC012E]